MSRKFEVGEKVRTIGGNVIGYDGDGRVICQFEDGGKLRTETFGEQTLESVPPRTAPVISNHIYRSRF